MDSRTMTDGAVDGRLELDVPCAQCGYNLRMRSPEDFCPECGLGVRGSIAHYEKAAGLFREPGRFRLGLLVLSCTFFFNAGALPVVYGLSWLSLGRPWAQEAMVLFFSFHRVMNVAAIVSGAGLIGSSLRLGSLAGSFAGIVQRLFYGCLALWAIGGLIVAWIYWRMTEGFVEMWVVRALAATRIFSSSFLAVAEIVGMMVLLQLLLNLKRRGLAVWTCAFFGAVLLLQLFNVLMMMWLSGMLTGVPGGPPPEGVRTAVEIVNAVFFLCFALFWLTLRRAVAGPIHPGFPLLLPRPESARRLLREEDGPVA
jgi:hypothetical protein